MPRVSNIGKILLFFVFFTGVGSCDNVQDSQVPDIPFNFMINLTIDNDLTIPGNSKYYPYGGYGGVIVYCESIDSYYAYDATCTYEVNQSCKVINTGVLGECKCCKSKFILLGGGNPADGPAAAPLRQYQVTRINSFTLRIYN